jgi:hypothetical protein
MEDVDMVLIRGSNDFVGYLIPPVRHVHDEIVSGATDLDQMV